MHTCVHNLSWSHVRRVLSVPNNEARLWYLLTASEDRWDVRTLDRNISTQYFERRLAAQREGAALPAPHAGQTDRAGVPYITHPLRVMEACNTTEEKIAAVLHDVVEDTSVTLDDLAKQFPPEIVEAVRCLTHLPEDTYEEYIEQIATNPISVQVKLRDLTDNMDVRRLTAIGEHDVERLRKYLKAYKRLSGLSCK